MKKKQNYLNYGNIFNFKEVPICFEMTSKTTVEKIVNKEVNIRIFG